MSRNKRNKDDVVWDSIVYFDKQEFTCDGIEDMFYDFIVDLDKLRSKVGFPIIITSGYRTVEYNESIGGVEGSSHCDGYAVDVYCNDSVQRLALINGALELGIKRLGIGKDFIHMDVHPDKPSCIWVY